jgi:hypothetical protein
MFYTDMYLQCEISENELTCTSKFIKLMTADHEGRTQACRGHTCVAAVDFISAPYSTDRRHLFEGTDKPETFFRTAVRNFLVYNMLINLDINESRSSAGIDDNARDKHETLQRRGLLYLLMHDAYSDALVLHDVSADDPYARHLRVTHPHEFDKLVRALAHTRRTFAPRQPA